MIGIYKITNLINQKSYIGQSIDIENRLKNHKKHAFTSNTKDKEYNKPLYCAIRKYGVDNFSYEILEECTIVELNNKEIFYIELYDTYNKGYNCNRGGNQRCEENFHSNHKLEKEDVYQIREYYNQHCNKSDVYELYKDRIGVSGFHKIWLNETWKKVHQDVYTEENRNYYLFERNSHKGSTNGRAILTEQDVYNIRLRKKNGETRKEVHKDYSYINLNTFSNVWYYQNWKHIVV